MNCPHCKARNPIGNKFCRECGQKLPLEDNPLAVEEAQQAEVERNRERAAKLLTEAFSLSQRGKPAEALPLAVEAAQLLPESTSALTLSATLHERLGQNDKAIAAMEKVVSLNPDSSVDADKLDRLRRGVHLLPHRPTLTETETSGETKRRHLPLVIAIGAGILVLSVGITAVVRGTQSAEPRKPRLPLFRATPLPITTNQGSGVAPSSMMGPLAAPPAPPQEARPDPFAPVGRTPLGGSVRQAGPRVGRPGSPVLPAPGTSIPAAPPQEGTSPFVFPGNAPSAPSGRGLPPLGGIQQNPDPISARPPQSPNNGPSIPAGPPQNQGNGQESEKGTGGSAAPPENPGFIRIRDHSSPGESGPRSSTSLPSDSLLKAQTLQASGKYREAITAYRDALTMGALVGGVQQGIALCYQRLGEKSSARTAYQQAIAAFEAEVRAGRGIEQASRGLAACRAALTVLGNGS